MQRGTGKVDLLVGHDVRGERNETAQESTEKRREAGSRVKSGPNLLDDAEGRLLFRGALDGGEVTDGGDV